MEARSRHNHPLPHRLRKHGKRAIFSSFSQPLYKFMTTPLPRRSRLPANLDACCTGGQPASRGLLATIRCLCNRLHSSSLSQSWKGTLLGGDVPCFSGKEFLLVAMTAAKSESHPNLAKTRGGMGHPAVSLIDRPLRRALRRSRGERLRRV
jgi:hypothetical protein